MGVFKLNNHIKITTLFVLLALAQTKGQEIYIPIYNRSFESPSAKSGEAPIQWIDANLFPKESPVDVQPGYFEVNTPPMHGRTYLGMVTRSNNTWEMVAQELERVLEKGKCFEFTINLCRSSTYKSVNADSPELKLGFNNPVKLLIWGGSSYNKKDELLGQTNPIIHTVWKPYKFKFKPEKTHRFILLEAYYTNLENGPYNGNILLDYASNISECPIPIEPEKTKPAPITKVEPKILNLDRKELKTGQKIKIDKLFFASDSTNIPEESSEVLNELYEFMKNNIDINIEIGGHTNTIPSDNFCDVLSTKRAKSVYEYLIKKGINAQRLTYKGYGKRFPIVKDNTANNKKQNQRVEIKITSIRNNQ